MIIKNTDAVKYNNSLYPDMFASEREKKSPEYIKTLMDYFYNFALSQYKDNCDTFGHNYRLLKGELRPADFGDEEVKDFAFELTSDLPMPSYVQQYSILNQPINVISGEESEKPDTAFVKAFDDDSKSEELEYYTDLLNQYVISKAQQKVYQKAMEAGVNLEDEEAQKLLQEDLEKELEDNLYSFTTQAEKWGNRVLEALKMEFNLKEVKHEVSRDVLICGRPRIHIYENNSPTGFGISCVNPKNVWVATTPDKKFLKGAYAGGLIEVKEISEIVEEDDLTKEEVDELREEVTALYGSKGPTSNLFRNRTGVSSIDYNPARPMVEERQMEFESALLSQNYENDLFSGASGAQITGQRHIVLTAYWLSKKKVGELVYIDQNGIEQTTLVDESYKSNSHPTQISLTWGYVNQWMQGKKYGDSVYKVKPLKIVEYFPIIGVDFENRNSPVKSAVDLAKPYQMIVNLCYNQVWELLQKEKGVMHEFNWRQIPVGKDETFEEALHSWLLQQKELGFVLKDDSPENMQAPTSNTNVSKTVDLTRSQEMQTRIMIAEQATMKCNALLGITPERLGGVAASQSVTGTQVSVQSSFSQTQIWSNAIEQVMNQAYQAIIDASQYVESQKEFSTISYISNEGENAFIKVAGSSLSLPDLRVFITSRSEDKNALENLRSLAQPMLQNGADLYTVSKLYVSNSMRELRETFKKEQNKRDEMVKQQREMEQAQLQQQQSQFEQMQAQQVEEDRLNRENDNLNKELDRVNKVRVALLNAAGRDKSVLEDADSSGVADALEVSKLQNEVTAANRTFQLAVSKQAQDSSIAQMKESRERAKMQKELLLREKELALKEEELKVKAKDSENKLKIASKNKNKYDTKSK